MGAITAGDVTVGDIVNFDCALLVPNQRVFDNKADMVILPGSEGDIGVLAGHAPILCSLREGGTVEIRARGGNKQFRVGGGFAQASPEGCIILADSIDKK